MLMDSKTSESLRNKIMDEFNEMQSILEQDLAHKKNLHKQELEVRSESRLVDYWLIE